MVNEVRQFPRADVDIPFYQPQGGEVELFEYAHRNQLPMLLKGPTGCGKTRFVEHMAARLGRPRLVARQLSARG
ncbi:MAG: AAA family ATPase, partial [Thiogranum sp.]